MTRDLKTKMYWFRYKHKLIGETGLNEAQVMKIAEAINQFGMLMKGCTTSIIDFSQALYKITHRKQIRRRVKHIIKNSRKN